MGTPSVHVRAHDDFEPSDHLRAALERVAAACAVESGSAPDREVEGFVSRLQIGNVDVLTVDPSSDTNWNDGCWGYSKKDSTCGWNTLKGDSCLGHSWGVKS